MSLVDVLPLASEEKYGYHRLSLERLEQLGDTESLYEHGRRFRGGVGVKKDAITGWEFNIRAALRGHPVALALCYDFGRGDIMQDTDRANILYQESAARGHAVGKR
jgi:hypothetical protein